MTITKSTQSLSKQTTEHELIELIKSWTKQVQIGDDCAILPGQMLTSQDTLVEGTHFLANTDMSALGWKSMAVNISDLAAMAGKPKYALVSLTLPPDFPRRKFEKLYLGMLECARKYKTTIVGGDLTKGPCLVISITIIGESGDYGILKRNSAKEGDVVIVSGNFGKSRAGLELLLNPTSLDFEIINSCKDKHLRPEPRLKESWLLAKHSDGKAACMDASDGLADALYQIAKLSNVSIDIDYALIPIDQYTMTVAANVAAQTGAKIEDWALYGGEDYELVATTSKESWQNLEKIPDCPFVKIGTVSPGSGVRVSQNKIVKEIDLSRGFQHWSK
jgi:thiamine-monophosphate kinase